jgi:hypothetical protein
MSFYRNIFLSKYCVPKCLVCIGPKDVNLYVYRETFSSTYFFYVFHDLRNKFEDFLQKNEKTPKSVLPA